MASETNLPPQRHSLKRILAQLQALMPELRAKYRVQQLELFGSYLRGDATLDSDVDILVTFQSPPTLLEFIELENYLGDVLQLKVDLVMKTALKPAIGERILSEAQPV
jgi:predicted nucleotidyltransferase